MCLQFINQSITQCESVLDAVLLVNYERETPSHLGLFRPLFGLVCSMKIMALKVFIDHFKRLTDAFFLNSRALSKHVLVCYRRLKTTCEVGSSSVHLYCK